MTTVAAITSMAAGAANQGILHVQNDSAHALCLSIAHPVAKPGSSACRATSCAAATYAAPGKRVVLNVPAGRMALRIGQRPGVAKWSVPAYVATGRSAEIVLTNANVPGAVGGKASCSP